MLYRVDLGFRAAALVLFLFVPVLALVVRWRWRLAAARQEEVRRLVALASEEAARVEKESALAYAYELESPPVTTGAEIPAAGVVIGRPQCAVCCSPTTRRCSRCKSVRYCSGKCQIIHWRQGHKEDCCPPPADSHCNGQVNVSNLKGEQSDGQADLGDNSLEFEGKPCANTVDIFSKRPSSSESNCSSKLPSDDNNLKDAPVIITSGTKNNYETSSYYSFSGPVETPDEASATGNLTRTTPEQLVSASSGISPDSLRESLSCDSFSDLPRTSVDVNKEDPKKYPPSEFPIASVHVNIASCSIDSNQKVSTFQIEEGECSTSSSSGSVNYTIPNISENTSGCQNGTLDSRAVHTAGIDKSTYSQTCQESDYIQMDADQVRPSLLSSRVENSSCEAAPLEETVQFKTRDTTVGIQKSGCIASGRTNDASLMKCKVPSFLSSSDGYSVLGGTSSKVDNAAKVFNKSTESTVSVPNGTNDLKTSVRRVVQQIKTSNFSRHYPSGVGSYVARKYNYKVLFPYDIFIKLYNSDKVELRPCGFTNCGNSCYANAVLQCLAFTRPLTSYLLAGLHAKTCPKKEWCFTCEFESLVMKAKEGKSPLSPIGIVSHIQKIGSNLGHGREEDAHEFLRYAIDAMQSACLKEVRSNAVGQLAEETTLIQLIFGGYLRSKIKCMRCQGKSERRERMMDLTVEIHGDIGTLEEALTRFTATEVLDGENKYECNRCKSYERAKKKLMILEAPNVLTIALKRYQSGKFGKLNKMVRFPEYLNLAPYMTGTDDKSPVYRLYGVVVHLDIMNAAFSGHYVCYVKNTEGKWYKIDDSMVKPTELDRVLKKGAYMLLYARCSPRAPSLFRKAMSQDQANIKKSKCKEDLKSKSSPVLLRPVSSAPQHGGQDYANRVADGPAIFDLSDPFNERYRHLRADSSSDSSSLLSCSDEGSYSTESTRDSTSTEDYQLGDSGRFCWKNSPLRLYEDSDSFTYSPLNSRHTYEAVSNGKTPGSGQKDGYRRNGSSSREEVCFQVTESPAFLYSDDNSEKCRQLTEQSSSSSSSSSSRENASVLLRRSSRERTAQSFY